MFSKRTQKNIRKRNVPFTLTSTHIDTALLLCRRPSHVRPTTFCMIIIQSLLLMVCWARGQGTREPSLAGDPVYQSAVYHFRPDNTSVHMNKYTHKITTKYCSTYSRGRPPAHRTRTRCTRRATSIVIM